MTKAVEPWKFAVGMKPFRVVAFEDLKRGGVVYLRWQRTKGKRTIRSLGFVVRGARGGLDRVAVERAECEAADQHSRLVQGRGDAPTMPAAPAAVDARLTIREGWARASDADTGRWNKDTAHRKDLERAVDRAVLTWGEGMTWSAVDRGQLRKLWRQELARQQKAGNRGVRAAQLTLALTLAIANWLRDEQLIAPTAALAWKQMDEEFADDVGEYTPAQPRYTREEYRALFTSAWKADERYGLAYALGAEYRIGQLIRSMRSHVDRAKGVLRIPGKGKKRGGVVHFTEQQRADLDRVLTSGYLAGLETAYHAGEITDYALFPGGHFAHDADGHLVSRAEYATRGHVDRSAIRRWHRLAEALADVDGRGTPITHVDGRGPYGSRRQSVDAAKAEHISREGLQQHGGWADSQMPDAVYADAEAGYARDEASKVRATIRGETPHEPQESSQIVTPNAAPDAASFSPED